MKGVQLCKYSTARTGFHYYDLTLAGTNQSRFALSTYVFFQLWFAMALFGFYYLFNFIFNEQHSPCFGGSGWTKLTETLFTDRIEVHSKIIIVFPKISHHYLYNFLLWHSELYPNCEVPKVQVQHALKPYFHFPSFLLGFVHYHEDRCHGPVWSKFHKK